MPLKDLNQRQQHVARAAASGHRDLDLAHHPFPGGLKGAQLPRNLTLNFGVANLFNEPQRYFRGVPDQLETFLINGTTITAGLEGRF